MWSFSSDRLFRQCQRQWYFRHILANANARAPVRREAYVLSKLQTVAGWRGQLVDRVLSTKIVEALNWNQVSSAKAIITEARRLFDLQLSFALAHRVREPGASPSKIGEAFAAFAPIEYGEAVAQEEIDRAWGDVERALTNFGKMEELKTFLKGSSYRVAQRALQVEAAGTTVKAFPDAILFDRSDPPAIVDWKVHQFGRKDYRLQLALYAFCLAGCRPHRDFPTPQLTYAPTDIRLLEVQLLTEHVREHRITEDDLNDLETYVACSAVDMKLACGGERNECRPEDFSVAFSPATCRRCAFRKLCWEGSDGNH